MNTFRLTCLATWIVLFAANASAQQHVEDYLAKPDFKAMVESPRGKWGAAWGYCSLDEAIKNALKHCTSAPTGWQKGKCRITHAGNNYVGDLPLLSATKIINRYRDEVETSWLEASRKGTYVIESLVYGGEAEDWDTFVPGSFRANPKAICLAEIVSNGPSNRCTGTARFAGHLNKDGQYPEYGEVHMRCSNGQDLKGESVSLRPGVGFVCLTTPSGGRVLGIFGPGSHDHATSDAAFLRAYEKLVLESGLDHELCGWGLLS